MAFITLLITIIICFTVGGVIYNSFKPKKLTIKDIKTYKNISNKIKELCKKFVEHRSDVYLFHVINDENVVIICIDEDGDKHEIRISYEEFLK